MPAMRNSAAVEKPWLSMYRIEPDIDTWVIAKMPSTMKPKWLTDVNAMSRIMSCEPMASTPP